MFMINESTFIKVMLKTFLVDFPMNFDNKILAEYVNEYYPYKILN